MESKFKECLNNCCANDKNIDDINYSANDYGYYLEQGSQYFIEMDQEMTTTATTVSIKMSSTSAIIAI